jgi:TP901 family phage tail tape measure protein
MTGQSKIEFIIELKNKTKAGLAKARGEINENVEAMKSKIAEVKTSFKSSFKDLTSEVPLLGKTLKLLTNPISIAVAGLTALYKGFDHITQKAAEFNTSFRGLVNMNLDKDIKQRNTLKQIVLDTAYQNGFNAQETVAAYMDVQSATGKYGYEAQRIVEKQGEFAKLMQTDFNSYIAGTAKAMANFGFGADKLDKFNESAYATTKTGIVSFDELTRAQSAYAGAAASAQQDFDTANKIFALFSVKTKSTDKAASLTSSIFNNLTKKSTIEAFNKVGISVMDASGKIKQVDTLMLELNKKFSKLDSDKKIVELKNQFSGSQGLTALIQAAADSSGQLQNTFENFDKTKFGLNEALEAAKNDINYIKEQLKNKIEVTQIRMSEDLLPVKEWLTDKEKSFVDGLNTRFFQDEMEKMQYGRGVGKALAKYGTLEEDLFYMTKEKMGEKLDELRQEIEYIKKTFPDVAGTDIPSNLSKESREKLQRTIRDRFPNKRIPEMIEVIRGERNTYQELADKLPDLWAKATNNGENILQPGQKLRNTDDVTGEDSILANSVTGVTGSAKQIRNITVNIDSFNKGGINTQNTTLQKMDVKQIEDWFIDACMRAVRNVELSYS